MSESPDKPDPVRGDPTWVAPALTRETKTRVVGKTPVFFGPPLAILVEGQNNTMEISGRLNRTAERFLEIIADQRRIELTPIERDCVVEACGIGFMGTDEIRELPDDIEFSKFEADGLDKKALAAKIAALSFVERVALIEDLGL
jgi:hypothetical protein